MKVFNFVKESVSGVFGRFFGICKSYALTLFYRIWHYKLNNRIVLVYSMGKVGSSSVYQSLKRRFPRLTVFHTHFLSDHWLKEKLPSLDAFFSVNIETGNKILRHIRENDKKRLTIITLVREPMIRDISNIFQNHPGLFDSDQELNVPFLNQWINKLNHDYTINWFNTEFNEFTKFDIYSVPFDKAKGFSIYSTDRADILCIKVERLDEVWEFAIKEFLSISAGIPLLKSNLSLHKAEKEIYVELKKSYKGKYEKLQGLYGSKYVKHFYSDAEISHFLDYWCEPLNTD